MIYVNSSQSYGRSIVQLILIPIVAFALFQPAPLRAQQPTPAAEISTPTPAAEPPTLGLPIPPGESWTVIQGYNCGTHDGWGRLSFDLANRSGRTRGAPVLAAADGTTWYWSDASGTLLLRHDDGYFTMYTHMQSHRPLPRGTPISRGDVVGTVGNVGAAHTEPHLHFTLYHQAGSGADQREPRPFRFAGGLSFPEDGSCNQYGGAILQAPPASEPLLWPRLIQVGRPGCDLGDGLGRAARLCAR